MIPIVLQLLVHVPRVLIVASLPCEKVEMQREKRLRKWHKSNGYYSRMPNSNVVTEGNDHRLSEGNREAMTACSSGAAKFQTARAPHVSSHLQPAQFGTVCL